VYECELRMKHKRGNWVWILDRGKVTEWDKDGRPVRMNGTHMDITDRKQAEERLLMSQYSIDKSSNAIFWMNKEGGFSYVNDQACRSLGYTREELLSLYLWDIDPIYPKEQWNSNWESYQKNQQGGNEQIETLHRRKDGIVFPVEVSSNHIWFGETELHVAHVRDITEKKKAEEAIKINNERFRVLIENATDMVRVIDENGITKYLSPSVKHIMGFNPEDLLDRSVFELIHPEDVQMVKEGWQKVIKTSGTIPNPIEARVRHADGSWHIHEAIGTNLFGNPYVNGFVMNSRDITERKRAEEAIKAAEENYRLIFENATTGIFQSTNEGKFLKVNPGMSKMFGYDSPEEMVQEVNNIEEQIYVNPEERKEFIRSLEETGEVLNFICENYRKDGTHIWTQENVRAVKNTRGEVIYYEGFISDITERMEAEEALKKNEAKLASIFRVAPTGIGIVINRVLMEVNDRICEMTGYTREELIGKSARILYPSNDDFEYVGREKYKQINEFGVGTVETRWQHKNGKIIDILLSSAPINPLDQSAGVTFTALDITERKRAEEAMQNAAREWETTFDAVSNAVWLLDADQKIVRSNSVSEVLFKKTSEQLKGHYCCEIVHGAERPVPECPFSRMRLTLHRETIELYIRQRWLNITVDPILDKANKLVGAVHTIEDITDRKLAEEALRESEQKFRAIVEGIPDELFIAGQDGCFIEVNHAACDQLGYSREELLRMKVFEIIQPDEIPIASHRIQILGNETGMFESIHVCKDGRLIPVELALVRMIINGKPAVAGIARDITARKRAKEALRESEEKFSKIFYSSPVPITITRVSDGCYVDVNDAFLKRIEFERNEVIGKTSVELGIWAHPSDREKMINALHRDKILKNYETNFFTKSRKIGTSLLFREIMELGDEQFYIETALDITDRKKAEEALKASEEKFSKAFHISPDSININRLNDGVFVEINDGFTSLTGFTAEETIGKSSLDINIWADPNDRKRLIEELMEKGEVINMEAGFKLKNGKVGIGLMSAVLMNIGSEKYILSVTRDITDRKNAEEALRESEERFRRIFEEGQIGITIASPDYKFINANPTFCRMIGYSVEELRNLSFKDITAPDQIEVSNKNVIAISRGELEVYKTEKQYLRKDGQLFWGNLMTSAIRDKKGDVNIYLAMVEDITERKNTEDHLQELVNTRTEELNKVNQKLKEEILKQKEAEEKVEQALKKEIELNQLRTRFISIASHEFRTPLSVILSSADLLNRYGLKWDTEFFYQQIQRIKKNVSRMTGIMDDVLIISRTDSGKITFKPGKADLENICNNILANMNVLLTKNHNLIFKYMIDDRIFLLDQKLLELILSNLLSNAIKYSVNGGIIEFTVFIEGKSIVFSISDNGIGIPEKDQFHLFDSFHRASNVGEVLGTGLGLSIVNRSVEMHGGSIEFSSKEGIGTKFMVKIPMVK
ncbi:MAG: PAS domain S-box protein, partial [Ignavibacteria bacterium]